METIAQPESEPKRGVFKMTDKTRTNITNLYLPIVYLGGLIVSVVAVVVYAKDREHAFDVRINSIENSRFTAQDGKEVWQEIERIRRDILTLEPPRWLTDKLNDMSRKIDRIEAKLDKP